MGKTTVDRGIYLKDAQTFLDECIKTHETVSVVALTKDGRRVCYDGWRVTSSWWAGGTHTLLNPASGQSRTVRDILIMSINNHPVYI